MASSKTTFIVPSLVGSVRSNFQRGTTKDLKWRHLQLNGIKAFLNENSVEIAEALRKDLRMDPLLVNSEVNGVLEDIEDAQKKIADWAKEQYTNIPLAVFPAKAFLVPEPYGVVLIISTWNYPVSLIIRPLVGAIAAGNAVVIKPSEVSESVCAVFAKLFPKYVDGDLIKVVVGGPEETQALLKEKFDKICYTGSSMIGKIVMKAAAEHLTPVLLELGGKSPLIVDKDVNLPVALNRIIWGKFTNAGQTCVAPDYALVHRDIYPQFLSEAVKTVEKFFGKNPKESPDYGRIVNLRHLKRLESMIESSEGKVELGGEIDSSEKFISPTIISSPSLSSSLMSDEIFGPILPVLPVNSIDEAIEFVNSRPKPLALYVFSNNPSVSSNVIKSTSSGGVAVNETLLHNFCRSLPFGGVGESGMGAYNSKFGFIEFSHTKPVLQRTLMSELSIRFPPYTEKKVNTLNKIMTLGKHLPEIKKFGIVVLVLVLAFVARCFLQN